MAFVPTVALGAKVAESLQKAGIDAPLYHGQLPPNQRELILARFQGRNEPACQMVVCTNAFGMGIDLPDVRLVVHWSHPASVEDFMQESGRAGRDGKPSIALLYLGSNDAGLQRFMATKSVEHSGRPEAEQGKILERKLASVEQIHRLAHSKSCVRRGLLNYFGADSTMKRVLALRILSWAFSHKTAVQRSTWCCDVCEPGWRKKLDLKPFSGET